MAGLALEHRRLVESTHKTARLAAVGETVAYLSHHIRNILQGMQGGAEVVELGLRRQDMEIARDGWMLVRRNLERTLHLAKNMLTFSKDRQPRIEPTDLNHLVGDVVSLVSRQAAEKAVTIVSKCEACPLIPLDEDGAHQLVHNLVINALEAVPEGTGQIGVRTRYESSRDEIVLTVQDNGPGIATTDFKRIFEAFQSSKGQGGTGLGLAAARKIVQEHHGRIEVESTVGQGTAFHVYLPANPKS
jgi:signal transduction histidine kinase